MLWFSFLPPFNTLTQKSHLNNQHAQTLPPGLLSISSCLRYPLPKHRTLHLALLRYMQAHLLSTLGGPRWGPEIFHCSTPGLLSYARKVLRGFCKFFLSFFFSPVGKEMSSKIITIHRGALPGRNPTNCEDLC